jgi:hypothetical protein
MLKALQCFLVFYYLFNESKPTTILGEFQKIMTNMQLLCIDDMDTSVEATLGGASIHDIPQDGVNDTRAGHLGPFNTFPTRHNLCVGHGI